MLTDLVTTIRGAISGQRAHDDVAAIIRHHRIQASPGYRDAANYILSQLKAAGLQAKIETYPASYQAKFWTSASFQEWECTTATLHLLEPAGEAAKLADYNDLKLSLIQRSASFSGEAEVVILEDGLTDAEYEGLDIAGKIVLTKGAVSRVHQLAIAQHGAIGIIFDGLSETPPVREAMDLPDVHQYTSFWWSGRPEEKQCFGFVLSPRQGTKLRRQIRLQAADDDTPPVKVRAEVEARFYDGEIEVVTATIPGQSQEKVFIVSHLCHPQPSANDNATGAAANLETARTLQRLINEGALPSPARNITFLWMPEMTGSYAYLARHEDDIPNLIAGLNLDMVGADQNQTGSVLLLIRPPEASASFAPDLLGRLRELIYDDVVSFDSAGNYSLHRYATTDFTGGSDHYIFSDPTVGVPMPMLNQWPDKFYHTSADTLDKVDPDSLARVGAIAAAYAYFIASAGQIEVTWLSHEMLTRFRWRLTRLTQDFITELMVGVSAQEGRRRQNMLERRVAFKLDRHRVALQGLIRLAGGAGSLSEMLYYEASRFANRELDRARRLVTQLGDQAPIEPASESPSESNPWEEKAATMTPRRLYRGPVSLISGLNGLSPAERTAWYELVTSRKEGGHTILALAEYWTDARRTALDIIEQIELETGIRDAELIVRQFELLHNLGLVEL
jgi:aminopeptidase YwaD